jgi:hypothetical protein
MQVFAAGDLVVEQQLGGLPQGVRQQLASPCLALLFGRGS